MLKFPAPGGVSLLEFPSGGVELRDRGFGCLHVVPKLAVQRGAYNRRILIAQHIPGSARTARKGDHAVYVKPANFGVGAFTLRNCFVQHQSLDRRKRERKSRQCSGDSWRCCVDFGQMRQQVWQIVQIFSQVAQQFAQFIERQFARFIQRRRQCLTKRVENGGRLSEALYRKPPVA